MKKDTRETVLIISLIAGIAVGALVGMRLSEANISAVMETSFLEYRESAFESFLSFFISSAALVIMVFLLGFSAVFQPLEVLLVAFKGLGLGLLARCIYSDEEAMAKLLVFLPFSVISSGILIFQARNAISMSMGYFSISITTENRLGMANEFREYIFRFFIYLLSCAVISALGCLSLNAMNMHGLF
ncbi:MAG: hypothetical protein LUC38_01550 [Oscillospiraceae bacterium]|nr:hypothetical protein [Ruminococcus sp.]MCD8344635.1 hypothetical protein [Oscillospiraceae bacterium]